MPRHPYSKYHFICCVLCALLLPSQALAQDPAGSVKNVTGEAQVIRAGAAPTPLKPGDRVFEKDVLTTGKGASLGLVLRDNSTLALGPGSRLVVERFLFEPEKGGLAQVLRLSRGSMAAVSGEIVKLNPEVAKVETPLYSIGIRGTHFLLNMEPGHETAEEKAQAVADAPTPKEGAK
ncbi:MAG: FecR domain-containing protein [Desulfovibrio sp.]|jgi:hypothetical protein|nr:FecR domain-containing protein [Desulfovibrio sp.]